MNGYSNGPSSAGPSAAAGAADGDPNAPPTVEVPLGPTNQPRLFVRNLTDKEATFHLSGVETAYANSLRRTMMADVPTIGACSNVGYEKRIASALRKRPPHPWSCLRYVLAIDQVLFLQNTSPLPDEMLAHRLGLVPLISRNVINGLRYTRVSPVERVERVELVEWARIGSSRLLDIPVSMHACACGDVCTY